ncbi:hypothetical protein [Rhodanobacter caeni]|uniref:Lipoprotein n=1 Tax=Rhodanobacter caeni TaxID=657654 RepID=A0ABP3E887_9GAMM
MPVLRHSMTAPLLLMLATLAACDRRVSWVDVDASGCNDARISAMNRDAELVHQMGAVCAVSGKAAAADRLRCRGNTLQVACRE